MGLRPVPIMMFSDLTGNPTQAETEKVTQIWQGSLFNANIELQRYGHLCIEHSYLSRDVRKPDICICKNKDADQLTAKLISAFVFATRIVQFLYYLNPKFQPSSHSVSPSLKKGHGKVLKKRHSQRAATCYEGTFKRAATC